MDLEERRWGEKENTRGKSPRWEMNLCISHGKMHFSHPGNSLAHGKNLFFPAVM